LKISILTTESASIYLRSAVVIPAAGSSVRMGSHKALLMFDQRYNFIQQIVSKYAEVGISKIVVVVNKDNIDLIRSSLNATEFGNVQLVLNEHPEWERFYSVKCGLEKVVEFDNCFIHNCDNPFVSMAVIRKLMEGFRENTLIVPEFEGKRGHPVLLSRNIIQAALYPQEKSSNLRSFLGKFKSTIISVDTKNILYNINSNQDYKILFPFSDFSNQ
jgi:molybdenum cofactor cytidylyltransferase